MSRMLFLLLLAACSLLSIGGCSGTSSPDSQADARDSAPPVEHIIVYKEAGRFGGWPANNGIWSWPGGRGRGDEIVVGLHLGYYKANERGHSIDRDKPSERVQARSLDGGKTWTLERPEAFRNYPDENAGLPACPGGINFTHPDFAMTCRWNRFYYSYDRCKSWQGPYRLPDFGQERIMARTDYIVASKADCLFFLTSSKPDGKEGRPFSARTTDGGKTLNFLSWIGPEPEGYSIMPATVRCSKNKAAEAGKLVSAIRRYERGDINKGWIDVYGSNDNGQSWVFLSKAADTGSHGGNPPSLVRLSDGRLCLIYGYRGAPPGIRAKLSCDEGKTWGKEIILRQDGRNWDLGYTRTVRKSDGRLVTAYYYTTEENPEQHIAATIWDPDRVN